jgi:hypothetical protein
MRDTGSQGVCAASRLSVRAGELIEDRPELMAVVGPCSRHVRRSNNRSMIAMVRF